MKRRTRQALRFTLPGLLAILTACTTLGPDHVMPESNVEAQWQVTDDPALQAGMEVNSEWWTLFHDPVLNRLVQMAYEQNLSLQAAGLRIMQARAQLGIAIGSQYPQVQEAAGAVTRQNLSENIPNFNPAADTSYWTANAGLNASWELDFWGRYRRGVESASASLGSQIAAYDNALVSLTGEVASTYIQIRTLEEQLAVARANVEIQEKGHRLADVRFRAGATSALDPAQALTLLRNTQSQVPARESQGRQSRNALSILLGMPPRDLGALLGEGKIPTAPADVALGVPAELLRRRPDIRQAELLVAAQNAQVGIAESQLYPSFSLTGSIGYSTSDTGRSDMGDIFSSDSFGYSFGPGFSWPILNYGRLKNNVRVQDARLEEQIVNYQNTVLEAAREVEDGLAGFLGTRARAEYLADSVTSARRSVQLSLIQYREGATDFQRVLDSQQSLLAQQDQYTSAKGSIVQNLVAVCRALGGGWQIRAGRDFIPEERQERMRERTDWGSLIPADKLPEELPEPPPTGGAQPLFNRPDGSQWNSRPA
jgi:NodT family efflux transporter outer membrane factor (OMF) lipoprotein